MKKILFPTIIIFFLVGCSGVELTPGGLKIDRAFNLSDVKDCEKISETETELPMGAEILSFYGGGLKKDHLIVARNMAAEKDGNRIIMIDDGPVMGNWSFSIYKCD